MNTELNRKIIKKKVNININLIFYKNNYCVFIVL